MGNLHSAHQRHHFQEEICGFVKATHHYAGRDKLELTFAVGDIMWVFAKVDDNWLLAEKDGGLFGYIPINYFTIYNFE